MKFAYTILLLLLPLLLVGGYFLHRYSQHIGQARLRLFGPATRLPELLRTYDFSARNRKALFVLGGLLLVAFALARPIWGPRPESANQKGAEFYFILDISKSMLVRDVKPDRLNAVKNSLSDWLKTRHGDRIGLILVAGESFVQAPLTSDYTALREVLKQSKPSSISLGGTNLPSAIVTATKALKDTPQKHKIVVIISDGENLDGDTIATIQQARTEMGQAVSFFTVGVGTPTGGKVPAYRRNEKINYEKAPQYLVRDEYGVEVNSRLDERELRQIAQAGGGKYYPFDPEGDTWNALYTQAIQPQAKRIDQLDINDYQELFQIPLALALLLLAYEISLSTRLKNPPRAQSIISLPRPGSAPETAALEKTPSRPTAVRALVILGLLALFTAQGQAETRLITADEAEKLVAEGKSEQAATELRALAQKNPDDLYALYNYGVAAYAAGQFLESSQAFSEVSVSNDDKLSSLALTQMGNAQYRLGQALAKGGKIDGTLIAWERATDFYREAIKEKSLKENQHNLDLVSAELEKLLLSHASKNLARVADLPSLEKKAALLSQIVANLEKALELNPKNPTTPTTLKSVKELYANTLTQLARQHRKTAEEGAAAAEKAGKDRRKLSQAMRQESQATDEANATYQRALEVTPENDALKKEYADYKKELADKELDEAAESIKKADSVDGDNRSSELSEQKKLLESAVGQIDKALEFDPGNSRAETMKSDAMEKLEKAYQESGDLAKEQGDQRAETNPAGAVRNFSDALSNYEKALEIKPENTETVAKRDEVQKSLAAAYTEAGKEAMAAAEKQAAIPTSSASDNKSPGEKSAQNSTEKSLQEQIGHMEKAAQSFAQSETLAPGENNAAELEALANYKLGNLRSQLDQALSQNAANSSEEGDGQSEPGESDPNSQSQLGGAPVKAPLSFSEIRGASEKEGQFIDKTRKQKIRDW